jgi:hypothetical protein
VLRFRVVKASPISTLAFVLLASGAAHATPEAPAILPLSEVQPGMVGQAFTVFEGTKPEPFKMRVVSVVPNFLPKQDIILMRAEDPRVQVTGIAAGMSGSPVYVDGKLMGAIAYGWSFSKEPLCGVTPIEAMRAASLRAHRPAGDAFLAQGPAQPTTEPRLQPVSLPLVVSGMPEAVMRDLGEELRGYGLVPVRAGGSGRRSGMAERPVLDPGATVGVALIRGDMNAVAMGTLTQFDGKTVLAFGHPMMGLGEVNLPLVSGRVHTIVASLSSSMKLVSPLETIGAMVQDMESGIVGELGRHASTIPVDVAVSAREGKPHTFSAEVALHRRLLPTLIATVVASALSEAEPDVTDMVVTMKSRLSVRGAGSVEIVDQMASPEGLSTKVLSQARGIKALVDVTNNPFAPAVIERLAVDLKVEYRNDVAEIVGASLPDERVRPGESIPVRVTLRPYAGQEFTKTLSVPIPATLAGKTVKLEIAAGALVRPDVPKPENLRGLLDNLTASYPAKSIVLSLGTPDSGVSLRGRLIPSLPDSALDTLRSSGQTRRSDSYRVSRRTAHPCDQVITGKQELTVRVREVEGR